MKNKVRCIVTGELLTKTPAALEKQAKKYGFASTDALIEQYLGREARGLLKEGKTVEEIRKATGCPIITPVTDETLIRFGVKKVKYT